MSHSPLDGVLLDDMRVPISGAEALLLHLRVARDLAKTQRWANPSLDAVRSRAQACQELLAQGLFPETLLGLQAFGLALGDGSSPRSLRNLAEHFAAYLREVALEGYLEPNEALWKAIDRHLALQPGLWVERTTEDRPIHAGLQDLQPPRLRALACLPELSGAIFSLATHKGGIRSGLFGGTQPLVEWLMDGVEQHGQRFPNEIRLEEPEGWGSAPWARALDGLYEGPLSLEDHQDVFRSGLVEGPMDLLRHGLEQICNWLDEGLAPAEITVIHPEPQKVAGFLAPLLAQEGIPLHVRGGLLPLIESAAWSPVWMLLMGVHRLDPCAVSAGLRASRRKDLALWADILANSDQVGLPPFVDSFMHLKSWAQEGATAVWAEFRSLLDERLSAKAWAERIEGLVGTLRLPMDSDDFFAPLGLLKAAWRDDVWSFPEMLTSLRAFLETARGKGLARSPEGIRLVAPSTLLEEWEGSEATLVLDLSEGAWPGSYSSNPDLDWNRKAAINQALLKASEGDPTAVFPPALQRFWLPRSENGDQIPRAFQREAYAFNKVLAMTRRELVALSPAQDEGGRTRAQGPFWTALEGAGDWSLSASRVHSHLRWSWEGFEPGPKAVLRAEAAQARTPDQALEAEAPVPDRIPEARTRWLKGAFGASPTSLQMLAACPFRSLAERVWDLGSVDAQSRLRMDVGSLAHRILQEALTPFVGFQDWPQHFLEPFQVGPERGLEDGPEDELERLVQYLGKLWEDHRNLWLAELKQLPVELWPRVEKDVLELLPNLAAALLLDARGSIPTKDELTLLYPKPAVAPSGVWTRRILALEGDMGPLEIPLENGRMLAVAGKMDRLERWDHGEGETFLRVTDYKTSKNTSLKAFAEGEAPFGSHLQMPLYMLLAERAYDCPATAVLIPLREEEPKPFTGHLNALVSEGRDGGWRGRLVRSLTRLDRRLEEGDFPPTPGDGCRGCELGALCGRPVDVETDEESEGGDD